MTDLGPIIDAALGKLSPELLASLETQQAVAQAVRAGFEAGTPAPVNPVSVQRVDTFNGAGGIAKTEYEVVDRRRPKGQRIVKSHPTREAAVAQAAVMAPIGGGTIQAQWDDTNEYLHDTDMEAVGNLNLYGVISGCGFTEGATMAVTVAAGSILHNGATVTVAGDTATLVADASNKQYGYIAFSSAGAVQVVTGSPAASSAVEPTKPELGDRVWGKAYKVEAAQTASNAIVTALDKRIPSRAPTSITYKYKAAAQTVSASTTLVDATASSGTLAFTPEANGVYAVEWYLPLTFTGTGGFRAQITGPAGTSDIHINEISTRKQRTDGTSPLDVTVVGARAYVTAFATDIAAANADTSATTSNTWKSDAVSNWLIIKAKIENGATATAITLQVAQNTANGTVVVGRGAYMRAEKIS